MFIELWNHGLAGSPHEACGEIDVFRISGDFESDVLRLLMQRDSDWIMECFGHLPTEEHILAEVTESREDEGVYLDTVTFKLLTPEQDT